MNELNRREVNARAAFRFVPADLPVRSADGERLVGERAVHPFPAPAALGSYPRRLADEEVDLLEGDTPLDEELIVLLLQDPDILAVYRLRPPRSVLLVHVYRPTDLEKIGVLYNLRRSLEYCVTTPRRTLLLEQRAHDVYRSAGNLNAALQRMLDFCRVQNSRAEYVMLRPGQGDDWSPRGRTTAALAIIFAQRNTATLWMRRLARAPDSREYTVRFAPHPRDASFYYVP
ncbi:hypothetical protein PYCC9005_004989 [Savitreella phatthalungensis]